MKSEKKDKVSQISSKSVKPATPSTKSVKLAASSKKSEKKAEASLKSDKMVAAAKPATPLAKPNSQNNSNILSSSYSSATPSESETDSNFTRKLKALSGRQSEITALMQQEMLRRATRR